MGMRPEGRGGKSEKNVDDVDEKRQAKPMHKISARCAVQCGVQLENILAALCTMGVKETIKRFE